MNHNSITSRVPEVDTFPATDVALDFNEPRIQLKSALEQSRAETLRLVAPLEETILCHQAHPNFSPVGWHWGHIGFTESLWLLEKMGGQPPLFPHYQSLFAADGLPKSRRRELPSPTEIDLYVATIRQEVLRVLEQLDPSSLRQQARLWWWVMNHEAQHAETIQMVLALQQALALPAGVGVPDPHSKGHGEKICIPAGEYPQGSDHLLGLDNERPRHRVSVASFAIDRHPVSQGDYQEFMDAGGYHDAQWWSQSGWQWLQETGVEKPRYQFAGDRHGPVCGLSWYEAEAYACFRGQRLPTETEWEIAAQSGDLQGTGQVWEWTATWFAPYGGFESFPYPGYSHTYFDQHHRVLKGGSWASRAIVKRPSFRNWYVPETREVFAGIRLAQTL